MRCDPTSLALLVAQDGDILEIASVRCSGVSASGARCTRTAPLPVGRTTPSDAFCYKHRRQRSWLRRLSLWSGASSCCSCTTLAAKTSESCKASAPLLLSVLAAALLGVGVVRRDVALCATGALGLLLAALWMCAAMWELLWRAVPLELAAQIAIDALQKSRGEKGERHKSASVA